MTPDPPKKKKARTRRQRSSRTVDETVCDGDGAQSQNKPARSRSREGGDKKCPLSPACEKAIEVFVDNMLNVGLEGLRKQYKDLAGYMAENYKYKDFEANPDKNRYADVVCLDESRVKLTLEVPPCTDYIHANWVKVEKHDRDYIATQGPLPSTIGDFWRLIFQEQCCAIVNLTKPIEEGKVKCAQYWPMEAQAYETHGKMFVQTKKVENEDKFTVYTIEVLPEGCSNSLVVKLIHMNTWPDRGVPLSARSVLRLLRLIATTDKQVLKGPVVVHCSAGIGRTGAIIMIDVVIRKLFTLNLTPDLIEIFKVLRNQRASAIQQEGQYIFVVNCALEYIKIKLETADKTKYKDRCDKISALIADVKADRQMATG